MTLEDYKTLACSQKIPEKKALFNRAVVTTRVLRAESSSYRPKSRNGKVGSLLDFTSTNLPLIVIPDLHARAYFLFDILSYNLASTLGMNCTVFEALQNAQVLLLCVGDILHSEARGYNRWKVALKEFMSGVCNGRAMTSEMVEGLATLSFVMELKTQFPQNFHILKGNHENILNEDGNGNYSFCKFVNEGEMVTLFMQTVYGEKVIHIIDKFEKSLPLVAAFPKVVVSHGEPLCAMTKEAIINAHFSDSAIKAFTWTRNKEADEGSVKAILQNLLGKKSDGARYIGGHRPVYDKYELWQDGLYVQIHNPEQENVAIVKTDKPFDPDSDIVGVERAS